MNNRFKKNRTLSVLQEEMELVSYLLCFPVVPKVLLHKRQRTGGEYGWCSEQAPRTKFFNMKVAALSFKSSKAGVKF